MIKYSFFLILPIVFLISSCGNKDRNFKAMTNKEILELGDSISRLAQLTLLQHVGEAMKNGGPVNAIDFCNIHASTIMDSISEIHQVQIGRIAQRNRNPKNAMTMEEYRILKPMEKGTRNDTLIITGSKRIYYKAIRLEMPACLKCHGTKDDISPETFEIIRKKYPADRATNFQLGDFRGAWKLVFE
jgi:hypothetical protein